MTTATPFVAADRTSAIVLGARVSRDDMNSAEAFAGGGPTPNVTAAGRGSGPELLRELLGEDATHDDRADARRLELVADG